MAGSREAPTVFVARRFRPGREADGAAWIERLTETAATFPGFVDSTTQAPGEQHPDDVVVVYRFETIDLLRDWLDSPARRRLLDEGVELVDGPAREQIVALADERTTVTAVASFRVRSGMREAFLEQYRHLQSVLVDVAGFVRTELVEPLPGTQDDTVIIFSFLDREHLDRWLVSDARADVLAGIDPLLDGDRTVNVVGGFAGWFPSGVAAPRRWKQAALVLLALYPTSLVIGAVRAEVAPDLATPLATLVANAIGVGVLSWWLMPWLTRTFDGWLRR